LARMMNSIGGTRMQAWGWKDSGGRERETRSPGNTRENKRRCSTAHAG
jgi:hypothetical protein